MVFYIPDQPQTLHMKPLKELGSQVAEFLTCAVEAFRIDPFSPDACHQLGLQLPRGWVVVCCFGALRFERSSHIHISDFTCRNSSKIQTGFETQKPLKKERPQKMLATLGSSRDAMLLPKPPKLETQDPKPNEPLRRACMDSMLHPAAWSSVRAFRK